MNKTYKKYDGPEDNFQISVAYYLDSLGVLWFHPPNGGVRDKGTAIKLKKQGVKPGVPDVCILEPRFQYHGLFIELKVGKNKTQPTQDHWLKELQKRNYLVKVSYSLDETVDLIDKYLGFK